MKYFYAVMFVLFSSSCFAGGWSQTGKIVEVYNLGWTVMVRMDGTFVDHSDGACTGTNYYAINRTNSSFEPIFSQILMAYASGKTTRFWVTGSCSGQGEKYQNISSIRSY